MGQCYAVPLADTPFATFANTRTSRQPTKAGAASQSSTLVHATKTLVIVRLGTSLALNHSQVPGVWPSIRTSADRAAPSGPFRRPPVRVWGMGVKGVARRPQNAPRTLWLRLRATRVLGYPRKGPLTHGYG
jgi:hypothetical protein